MPMIPKSALKRLEDQKALLAKRRAPVKGKVQKFRKRLLEYPIEIQTEVADDDNLARDFPYRIQAENSVQAVLEALADFESRVWVGETITRIKIGPGKWLEREPIGRQK